jgi:lipoprotein-anchoring transpeptidase ErfK/SrfK
MKNITSSFWLRCTGAFVICAAIGMGGLSAASKSSPNKPSSTAKPSPAAATSVHDKIAHKLLELQESEKRWIQIDLASQRLIAWEGSEPVYAVKVSTGKQSTPTRIGAFAVKTKHRATRMSGPGYDVTNVPHTMYYFRGYAIHGAYWHNKFGTPVSHGCVNVAVNHAKWLFNWSSVGTPVIVHN